MSSFTCQHLDFNEGRCQRLKSDCVPGRPGCVLGRKSGFAFSVEERLANRGPLSGKRRKLQVRPPSEQS